MWVITRYKVAVGLFLLFLWKGPAVSAQPLARQLPPELQNLIAAQRFVLESMNKPDSKGALAPLDDPEMRLLLDQGWNLLETWAAIWLDLHPEPTERDLEHLFEAFTPPPHDPEVYDPALPERYAVMGSATRITSDLYVVTANYQEAQSAKAASTFFVVERDASSHFKTKWSIKPLAQQHYSRKDEIGRWALLDSCAYYCGPLIVQRVIALPSANSRPRFAVDAYQATNGSTLVKQFSIWEWDSTAAKKVIIESYLLYVDDGRTIRLANNLLLVPTKERTASFSSYGCCGEPRGMWTLRLTSNAVQDQGHRFVQPQILWADRLLAALHSKRVADVQRASPYVFHYLRGAEIVADAVDTCQVQSSGDKGKFEISFGSGSKLWLSYRLRNGQPYFTDVRVY